MRVKAIMKYRDKKTGKIVKAGTVIEDMNKIRFEEIQNKGDFLEKINELPEEEGSGEPEKLPEGEGNGETEKGKEEKEKTKKSRKQQKTTQK